jgi:hypothetical protein
MAAIATTLTPNAPLVGRFITGNQTSLPGRANPAV